MKGLEEARKFYEEAGAEMISRNFGDFENRIAVGLVGQIGRASCRERV